MKIMKNSISTAVSIIVLALSVAVIGSDHAMAKEKKQRGVRSTSNSQRSSASGSVPRSRGENIKDGTSNTIMVGRSAAGIVSPRDPASGLPTGIISGNPATHLLRGRRNPNAPGGWATFPSSRKGKDSGARTGSTAGRLHRRR